MEPDEEVRLTPEAERDEWKYRALKAEAVVSTLLADNGPVWGWGHERGIGREEYMRRRRLIDLALESRS